MATNFKMTFKFSASDLSDNELTTLFAAAQEELSHRRREWVKKQREKLTKLFCAGKAQVHTDYHHKTYIIIERKDGTVIAGMSRCSGGDEFDFEVGEAIAYAHAVGAEVPKFF